jgi:hypothetical protein
VSGDASVAGSARPRRGDGRRRDGSGGCCSGCAYRSLSRDRWSSGLSVRRQPELSIPPGAWCRLRTPAVSRAAGRVARGAVAVLAEGGTRHRSRRPVGSASAYRNDGRTGWQSSGATATTTLAAPSGSPAVAAQIQASATPTQAASTSAHARLAYRLSSASEAGARPFASGSAGAVAKRELPVI